MHTLNRLLTLVVACLIGIPLSTFAFVTVNDRSQMQQSLTQSIGSAVQSYQHRGYAQSLENKGNKLMNDAAQKLPELANQAHATREEMIAYKRIVDAVARHYNLAYTSSGALAAVLQTQQQELTRLLRAQYLGDHRSDDVIMLQMTMVSELTVATEAAVTLDTLEKEREPLLAEYRNVQHVADTGEELVLRSAEELAQIKAITAQVHREVLGIQGQLARMDAQLQSKAERELIAKGLLDPGKLKEKQHASAVSFSWPAYGHVSAGFLNAAYFKYFGVPHYGTDIVVSQGSPVSSAADGIVFLVRDGGIKGYSYILVGHKGGYATLYGHISQALVSGGQQVTAGQEIALSGGTPGTPGAGPMTTAAHLHFEVILNGVNIDPVSVLPQSK